MCFGFYLAPSALSCRRSLSALFSEVSRALPNRHHTVLTLSCIRRCRLQCCCYTVCCPARICAKDGTCVPTAVGEASQWQEKFFSPSGTLLELCLPIQFCLPLLCIKVGCIVTHDQSLTPFAYLCRSKMPNHLLLLHKRSPSLLGCHLQTSVPPSGLKAWTQQSAAQVHFHLPSVCVFRLPILAHPMHSPSAECPMLCNNSRSRDRLFPPVCSLKTPSKPIKSCFNRNLLTTCQQ